MLLWQIFLTRPRQSSLSSIASGKSSRLHHASKQSCCNWVKTSWSIRERPSWVRPCFSSSDPQRLVRLIWIVLEIGDQWPYNCCFLGCCFQDLFRIARKIFILIIMSCRQYRYPWPSLATSPYRSSPLAGLQGYIPYPHRIAVCRFELVVLLLLGHMRGSTGIHHL